MGANQKFVWSVGVFFVASLFIFQNCGSSQTNETINRSSESGQDVEVRFANKEVIAKLKDRDSDADFREWALGNGLTLETDWPRQNMHHWRWEAETTVEELLELASKESFAKNFDFIEPNYMLSNPIHEQSLPELVDPENGPLTGLSFNSQDLGRFADSEKNETIHGLTGITEIQGMGDPNEKVLVAVLDTGLDVNHSFFSRTQSLWTNPGEIPGDGIDNDGNGRIDDIHGWNFLSENADISDRDGHGTHCAGTVLNVGVEMLKEPVDESPILVMGLKFIGEGGGKTSDAIKAIDYAVAMGAQVLSNSWGGPSPSQALMSSLANASNRGLFIAAAAGNDSANNDQTPSYPANIVVPNLVSVAATDSRDNIASFSNFGLRTVHLSAPGVSVLSTYPTDGGEDRYNFLSGTSMATPYVAGTAAMMFNANPQLSGFDVKKILLDQVDATASVQSSVITGGRLNSKASREVASESTGRDQPLIEGGSFASLDPANQAQQGPTSAGGCGSIISKSGGPPGPGGAAALLLLCFPLAFVFGFRQKSVTI